MNKSCGQWFNIKNELQSQDLFDVVNNQQQNSFFFVNETSIMKRNKMRIKIK